MYHTGLAPSHMVVPDPLDQVVSSVPLHVADHCEPSWFGFTY